LQYDLQYCKKKLPSPGTRLKHGAKRREKIVTDVLDKCKLIQNGRVTNNVTSVTFSLRSKILQMGLPGLHSH
jgi:hypothetical protein